MSDRMPASKKSSPAKSSPLQPGSVPDNRPLTGAALNSAQIVQLQRIIGNRQVRRMLDRGSAAIQQRAAPGKVQRKMNYGLIKDEASNRFVNSAHAYIHDAANSQKSIADLAAKLTDLVNGELAAVNVPEVDKFPRTEGSYGEFDFISWTMVLNTNIAAANIGALAPDKAASFVNTIYHEARHAQQTFHIAQVKAGQGWQASKIHATLKIPLKIALKAALRPIKNPDAQAPDDDDDEDEEDRVARDKDRAFYKDVEEMYDSVYGVDGNYRRIFVSDIRRNAKKVVAACEGITAANLTEKLPGAAPAIAEAVEDWTEVILPDIDKEQTRLNAILVKSDPDKRKLKYLDDLKKLLEEADTLWDGQQTTASMAQLGRCADAIHRLAYAAYLELPEETDAHAVGKAAENQYKAKNVQNAHG